MEVNNKRRITLTIVAVVTLIALIAGATYAYFAVGVTNNFGTSTINATAEDMGSVALNGTNAKLLMDLSASDMMKGNAGTYFASSTGTTRNATEVILGTATLTPTTDTRKYECTYTLNITHSSKTNGADDIYDVFSDTTKYANKSKDQIYLSVNGKDYDWYNGFPSSVTGKIYVSGGVPAEIKVGMRLINSTSIDQSALAGHDIQINVVVPNNGFSCEIVDNTNTNKIPENGVYLVMENNTPTKAYYTNVSDDVKTQINNYIKDTYSIENFDLNNITKEGEEFPNIQENDIYFYGDYYYGYLSSNSGWKAKVLDQTKTSYGELLSEINGIPLTSMESTFEDCTNMVEAPVIPNSVTNMQYTFFACESLTSAPTIPNSVTNMQSTFSNCTSLETPPTIGTSVTNMRGTFAYCESLTSAPTIPNGVTDMTGTFSNCTSLTSAPEIPNSVTNMSDTFGFCQSLTSAPIIPNSVTNMNQTFRYCTRLTSAPVIPNSVTNMGGTFAYCTSLTSAPTIPNSVTKMSSIFSHCTSLTGVPIVNANPTDYNYAFSSTQITGIGGSTNLKAKLYATKNS